MGSGKAFLGPFYLGALMEGYLMPESNVEKKIDGKDGTGKRIPGQLLKFQEKSTERENTLINDLKARHVKEIKKLQEENAEKDNKFIRDLEVRHAQEIQSLEAESAQRERKSLEDLKIAYQAQSRVLVMALLRTKSERDRFFLSFSWIAVATLVTIAFIGFMHDIISKILTFAALTGFVGTIIFVRQSLNRNNTYLDRAMEGTIHPDKIWEEGDGRPLGFLIGGFISLVFLGLTLFINPLVKIVELPQTTGLSGQRSVAVGSQTTGTTQGQTVLSPTTSIPAKSDRVSSEGSPISVKTSSSITGNGGNFIAGSSQK
jgi:hypothetical protein